MKPVRFHRAAKAELDKAIAYYRSERDELGAEFQAEIENKIELISRHPQIGAPYGTTGYRYFVAKRFPYVIFYADNESAIWIVAISHASRRPGYWRRRKIS
jgi:toxin ParE1/3/4